MTAAEVTPCGDGHLRRVIYGLGPYIADYPEQALLACIVQGWCPRCTSPPDDLDVESGRRSQEHTDTLLRAFDLDTLWNDYGVVGDVIPFTADFPRADIHELIAPDLLHQLIKGTFKDHLVDWVGKYLELAHGKTRADRIMADIDRRIAAAPSFPGLRRFPEGRGFNQWTGDDSKALMKVYLPAITGHVPPQVVRAIRAFLDFCYLVRRSTIDEDTLLEIDDAVSRFHYERDAFAAVRLKGFSLPRQHSMVHYRKLIQLFGAPNGLCSSITESKHIKAVKEPWRRSNRFEALGQMLLTNQRLDKLIASRVDFTERKMLSGPRIPLGIPPEPPPEDQDNEPDGAMDGPRYLGEVRLARCRARGYPAEVNALAAYLTQPSLPSLIRHFLYDQLNPDAEIPGSDIDIDNCPPILSRISVFHSALAIFYAPSDDSGVGGMHRERIRAVPSWRRGPARYDCIFAEKDPDLPGFCGLHAARVKLFFSFIHEQTTYPCALVEWFVPVGDEPCKDTGMWIVEPDLDRDGQRVTSVIHVDCILRGAHLLPVFGDAFIPEDFSFTDSLDAFVTFYVNKFADHHANEIAF